VGPVTADDPTAVDTATTRPLAGVVLGECEQRLFGAAPVRKRSLFAGAFLPQDRRSERCSFALTFPPRLHNSPSISRIPPSRGSELPRAEKRCGPRLLAQQLTHTQSAEAKPRLKGLRQEGWLWPLNTPSFWATHP
jgi:hypothetical protein